MERDGNPDPHYPRVSNPNPVPTATPVYLDSGPNTGAIPTGEVKQRTTIASPGSSSS